MKLLKPTTGMMCLCSSLAFTSPPTTTSTITGVASPISPPVAPCRRKRTSAAVYEEARVREVYGEQDGLITQVREREENIPGLFSTIDQEEQPTKSNTRRRFLANLPIEKDQELTIDQKIIASIINEPSIEIFFGGLVLLSSFLVAVSTVNTIDLKTFATIIRAENVIGYIFAIEFFVRWYAQFTWKGIIGYLAQPLVLVDLVVVILPMIPLLVPNNAVEAFDFLPNWLFSSSGIINLRLLRILRLQRVLVDMDTFAEFQMALGVPQMEVKPYKLQLARVVLTIFTLLSVSSGLIYSTEHTVNPGLPDYFTALYFGLTTLTTVGFGDITPITPEGKLVVSCSILAGVAVIPAQAAALVEALLARQEYKKKDPTKPSPPTTSKKEPVILDMVCSNCEAGYHWSNAEYCWSCGTKL